MLNPQNVALMVIFGLLVSGFHALPAQESTTPKQKLAVLRITYDSFSDQEKEMVNKTFYDSLARDDRIIVMTENEAREQLIPLGIEPAEIANEQGYIAAGRILEVDYILVGTMDKIGDFVEVTFRTFKMPRGTQKRYPGGKTLDMLVKEEIPNIINLIYNDLDLPKRPVESTAQIPTESQPENKPEIVPPVKRGRKPPWVLITLGGVAGGAATFFLLSSGGGGQNNGPNALPRPPKVP